MSEEKESIPSKEGCSDFICCSECRGPTEFKVGCKGDIEGKRFYCPRCYKPNPKKQTTIAPMEAPTESSSYAKPTYSPKQKPENPKKGYKKDAKDYKDHKDHHYNDGANDSYMFSQICRRHTKEEILKWVEANDMLGTFGSQKPQESQRLQKK